MDWVGVGAGRQRGSRVHKPYMCVLTNKTSLKNCARWYLHMNDQVKHCEGAAVGSVLANQYTRCHGHLVGLELQPHLFWTNYLVRVGLLVAEVKASRRPSTSISLSAAAVYCGSYVVAKFIAVCAGGKWVVSPITVILVGAPSHIFMYSSSTWCHICNGGSYYTYGLTTSTKGSLPTERRQEGSRFSHHPPTHPPTHPTLPEILLSCMYCIGI